ncbi:methyltransferase domain-containing protein [Alteraurantiacibacter aestuarii]
MTMQTAGVAAAYDRWAPIYDLVFGGVFATGRREAVVAAEQVGQRILEVGIGTGISLPHYRADSRLTGVDISQSMLAKAEKRAARLGLCNIDRLAAMDAERMQFADDEFDVVVAQYVVTSVPDPEAALDEFLRVVKPGGQIIITTRIGAGHGLRGSIEKALMPVTSKLGWRTEFPWKRYQEWAARNSGVRLIERRDLPPLGHFSLLRYEKIEG